MFCPFGKGRDHWVPSKSLVLPQGLRPLHETETQIQTPERQAMALVARSEKTGYSRRKREAATNWKQRTVSQDKGTAICCRRLRNLATGQASLGFRVRV